MDKYSIHEACNSCLFVRDGSSRISGITMTHLRLAAKAIQRGPSRSDLCCCAFWQSCSSVHCSNLKFIMLLSSLPTYVCTGHICKHVVAAQLYSQCGTYTGQVIEKLASKILPKADLSLGKILVWEPGWLPAAPPAP